MARADLVTQDYGGREGEILELKDTINTMVDQLNGFAGEVTRVAREVGIPKESWRNKLACRE